VREIELPEKFTTRENIFLRHPVAFDPLPSIWIFCKRRNFVKYFMPVSEINGELRIDIVFTELHLSVNI
jgi:hypothetical protein